MNTRGKQKIDPAVREYHMRRIEDARARLWGAKAEFEERKRREWAEHKARLEADTYEAVWAARDAKLIIEDIKHAYGVSNASVIYGVLRAKPQGETEPPTTTPTTGEMTRYTLSDLDDRLWLVTDSTNGRTVEVNKVTRKTGVNVGDPALGPEMRRDPNHEAWVVVPETNGENP